MKNYKKQRQVLETLVSAGALISCELDTLCRIVAALSGRCVKSEVMINVNDRGMLVVNWPDGVSELYHTTQCTENECNVSVWRINKTVLTA